MAEGDTKESPQLMSKTLLVTGYGGYDKMKIEQRPRPKPEKGQVLVHVKATGINFAELMCRQGIYDRIPKLPAVLGFEAAGVIEEIGEGVTNLKAGDRIIGVTDFGFWAEYATCPEEHCFIMPEKMTFEEGAAIPVNYLTAYMMLFDFGNLRPHKKVLVHMAAGGVGIAAIQLCKTVPNVTVYGTASAPKHDIIKEQGCAHPIDYRTKDYATEIRKISPEGVDIVLDPLGGKDSTIGYDLLKPMGKIIHFGAANMVTGAARSWTAILWGLWNTSKVSRMALMTDNRSVAGFHLGHMTDQVDFIRNSMAALIDLYNAGKIKPRIDSVWAFEEVDKAMAQMHDRKNIGKVILVPEKPKKGEAAEVDKATEANVL